MDYTIYYNGMPVDHVTARSLESAQQHADATSKDPVVAVSTEANADTIALAKFQSRLLAAKVTDRIDMVAAHYTDAILTGLGGGFSAGTRDMVEKDIRAALHLFRQSSNSGMAASALVVGGVQ